MKIKYELTEKEIECLKLIKGMGGSYNYSRRNDDFRKKYEKELEDFYENGFTEHNKYTDWITYDLTDKAKNYLNELEK